MSSIHTINGGAIGPKRITPGTAEQFLAGGSYPHVYWENSAGTPLNEGVWQIGSEALFQGSAGGGGLQTPQDVYRVYGTDLGNAGFSSGMFNIATPNGGTQSTYTWNPNRYNEDNWFLFGYSPNKAGINIVGDTVASLGNPHTGLSYSKLTFCSSFGDYPVKEIMFFAAESNNFANQRSGGMRSFILGVDRSIYKTLGQFLLNETNLTTWNNRKTQTTPRAMGLTQTGKNGFICAYSRDPSREWVNMYYRNSRITDQGYLEVIPNALRTPTASSIAWGTLSANGDGKFSCHSWDYQSGQDIDSTHEYGMDDNNTPGINASVSGNGVSGEIGQGTNNTVDGPLYIWIR